MELNWNEILTGEMLTFALLGKAFYADPDPAWLRALATDEVFAEAPFAASQPQVVAALQLLQTWSRGISDQAIDDARADYTRLFIGPGQVVTPPWESVFFSQERLTFQQETLQVREWYRRFGLQAERLYQEPDDHIGLELEFVAHLANLGLRALAQTDQAEFDALIDAQKKFLTEHLTRWAFDWCAQVEQHAHTDFYRGIAMLTRGALAEAARVFGAPTPAETHA
ncbi:MAG: molecular chaperone TorD family protein [Chloroflexi bacterium]|nr:molecular chaperone TorD family protein [Chloroflexota bacterium]